MNKREETYTRGGQDIKNSVLTCEDDGADMRYVGSAGCPHDDNYTYFYQCTKCMKMETVDSKPWGYDKEEFEKAGWKLKEKDGE